MYITSWNYNYALLEWVAPVNKLICYDESSTLKWKVQIYEI